MLYLLISIVGGTTLSATLHTFSRASGTVPFLQEHLFVKLSQMLFKILQSLSEIQTSPKSPCTKMVEGVILPSM